MAVLIPFLVCFFIQVTKSQLICQYPNVTCVENDLVKIYWELNGLHQNDSRLIDFIKTKILVPPDPLPLNLRGEPSMKRLGGQFDQVPTVEKLLNLKKSRKKGFFIEAGASCGEFISNTLFFEMQYKWTGLLVEPNPDLLKSLYAKHRNAWILPHCLSTTEFVEVVNFDVAYYNRLEDI